MFNSKEIEARKAHLSSLKKALLAKLVQGDVTANEATSTISPHSPAHPLILSYAQEQLWFNEQLIQGTSIYNVPIALRLEGTLEVSALECTLNQIVARHEILRTTFITHGDLPEQVILPRLSLPLTNLDFSNLQAKSREREAQRQIILEAHQPFHIEQGPLIRTRLLRMRNTNHLLLVTMHHIICDMVSIKVMMRELAVIYNAYVSSKPSPLPNLPVQYADFATWQRQWLVGEDRDRLVTYWQAKMRDAPTELKLPFDRPRSEIPTVQGASIFKMLPKAVSQALQTISQRENATFFMVLLAAFQVLLFRYTGQDDIVIGSPVANRTRNEIAELIGFFVNMVAFRADLAGNPPFSELVRRVRKVCLEAYAHQELPFEKLVEVLHPQRKIDQNLLFQVTFALQTESIKPPVLQNLKSQFEDIENNTAKFDLAVELTETADGLKCHYQYNTALFHLSTIQQLATHFQVLLEGIIKNPEQPIGELPLLMQTEYYQLLRSWNKTDIASLQHLQFQTLFETQARERPDALAVIYGDAHLTYLSLNQKANQLAWYLQSRGVKPDIPVGICMERSLEMMIGLLGVIKAGGAYMPLEPHHPRERLFYMLEDAHPLLVLTQTHLSDQLSAMGVINICLDTIALQGPIDNPPPSATLQNLAYVIYTSGSTGKPKGVMVSWQGLHNYINWGCEHYQVATGNGSIAHSSIGFDLTITSLFLPLAKGNKVILIPEKHDIEELASLIRQHHPLSILKITPAHLKLLIQYLTSDEISNAVYTLIIGGEALAAESAVDWYKHAPQTRVINEYGPTETIVGCSIYEVSEKDPDIGFIPIGRPIGNAELLVLDTYQNLMPIGCIGELCIGGQGLARGYKNCPDLTAERFIPHPFSSRPGERLYRSGDLGRYRFDGTIEFLGRMDHQVKLRGYRIESGEIETVLNQHPELRESVVIVREDEPGDRQLVAYVVPIGTDKKGLLQQTISANVLREYLKKYLPDYMCPSSFVLLDTLPLTHNGKIDRRALPMPSDAHSQQEELFIAPRTLVEQQLTAIWMQVLRVDRVSIHDNFFTLGGDSIQGFQFVAKAKRIGLHLTTKQLFQYQTIAQLSAIVSTQTSLHAEQGTIIGTLPLTPIQHWFFEQHLLKRNHWNHAMLLEVATDVDVQRLEYVLSQVLLHHDVLHIRFIETSSGWQAASAALPWFVPFNREKMTGIPEAELQAHIEAHTMQISASLDISTGPLINTTLFELGDHRPDKLLILVHHLVIDGVSWRILLEDIHASYEQVLRKQHIQLPQKTTSFQQWAVHLLEYAQLATLSREFDYWRSIGLQKVTSLSVDHPEGTNTVDSACTVQITLSHEETSALLHDISSAYHTQISDVLLTALALALKPWIGASTILIDMEGHGREELSADIDLSRTVGWFTTLFPFALTTDFATIESGIKTIKEQIRHIPSHGIGYGILRYLSKNSEIREILGKIPNAAINFNYLGQFDQVLSIAQTFQRANEFAGPAYNPQEKRTHLLEIIGRIENDQLHFSWIYSKNIHHRTTIEQVASRFVSALQKIVAHCLSDSAGGFTPSDFPLIHLGQTELDSLINRIVVANQSPIQKKPYKIIQAIYPLSPMQLGMLYHTWHTPSSGIYVEQLHLIIHNQFEVETFIQSWQFLVERHEIFRTGFYWSELAEPVQVVYQSTSLPITQIDWRQIPELAQKQRLTAYLNDDRKQGFEPDQEPLLRLAIIRMTNSITHIVWSFHHSLLDGWSISLVIEELNTLYEALHQKHTLHLKPHHSYQHYIAWLQKQDAKQAATFWQQTLQGFTYPTPLMSDRKLALGQDSIKKYAREDIFLTVEASNALHTLTRQYQLTLNTILQGAWGLLLSRYSGEGDVVFGGVVLGRPQELPEVEEMVGLFINTIPIRIRIDKEDTICQWLQKIQSQNMELRQYEYSSLLEIQKWSDVAAGQNLFETVLAFENFPPHVSERREKRLLNIETIHETEQTNYPLALRVAPAQRLWLNIDYDSNRFEKATIQSMIEHLAKLLEMFGQDPLQRVCDVSMLTLPEHHLIIEVWNQTKKAYPPTLCLHQLFEHQVTKTPDTIALHFEGASLTYKVLNQHANQLAKVLQKWKVGPEVLVGICAERSLEMVIGLIAILKAGGAYLPLDPEYPRERLAFLLEDAHISVLLVQKHLVALLPDHTATVIYLDTNKDRVSHASQQNCESSVTADNLVYVMYTSGSTGKPKGVMNTHRGLYNRLQWMQRAYYLTETDHVLQKTPFSFDVSVWEFFWPLMTGARLILSQPGGHRDSAYLLQIIQTQSISILHFVPSMMRIFLEERDLELCWSLRMVISSGEALTFDLQERFFTRLQAALHNLYGPTEASIDVTAWSCKPHYPSSGIVPIGYPIANIKIYLLDAQLRLVPIGLPGELYISGVGIARGYLNRPELTAERFVPDPFGNATGSRLYATGDIARYKPTGDIEYLGRSDSQIKLHGLRIELGEIEAHLRAHAAVQDAVVLMQESTSNSKKLSAYIVPDLQQASVVRRWLHYEQKGLPAAIYRHILPNGMAIASLNKNETDFLYKEIFVERGYLRHGITLHPGACIFDVGANIGLFTLFVSQQCQNATIFSFEPIPAISAVLQMNIDIYDLPATPFTCGLSKESGQETFTYYPHISILSGRFADSTEEREVINSFLRNSQTDSTIISALSNTVTDELLTEHLNSESVSCQLKTLSQVIHEHHVQQIDLLKIDVEKSELDVLSGIQADDWEKIKQIVIEVYNSNTQCQQVVTLLQEHDYDVVVEQDQMLQSTSLYNIYALRRSQKHGVANLIPSNYETYSDTKWHWNNTDQLLYDIRSTLREHLPEYMVPTNFILIETLPLTTNGKVDQKRLSLLEHTRSTLDEADIAMEKELPAPRNPIEQSLLTIWMDVLDRKHLSIFDNFYEIGGDSLQAILITVRVQETFMTKISLQRLFETPTLAGQAEAIMSIEMEHTM